VKRPTFEKTIEDVINAASDYISFDPRHAPDDELSPEDQSYLESLLDGTSDSK